LRSFVPAQSDLLPQEPDKARRRKLFWLGIVLACIATALSMLSGDTKKVLHTKGKLHPWLHLVLFFVLGGLSVLSTLRTRSRVLLVFAAVALGITIEFTQAWRFQARLETEDMLVDLCGVVLGAFAAWLSERSSV
jgi:VanZ family protein